MASFKKMILVPLEKKDNPEIRRRSELDEQMAKILKRNDIDDREKFRMYQRLLELYLRISQDATKDSNLNSNNNDTSSEIIENSGSLSSNSSNSSNNVSQSFYDDYDEANLQKSYSKQDHLAHVNKFYKTTIDDSILNSNKRSFSTKVPKEANTSYNIYDYNEPSPLKPVELRILADKQKTHHNNLKHNIKQVDNLKNKINKSLYDNLNKSNITVANDSWAKNISPSPVKTQNFNSKINESINNPLNQSNIVSSNDSWSKKIFPTPDKTQLEVSSLDHTHIKTPIIDSKFITNREKPRDTTTVEPNLPEWEEYKSKSKKTKEKHLAKIQEENYSFNSDRKQKKKPYYKSNSRRTLGY